MFGERWRENTGEDLTTFLSVPYEIFKKKISKMSSYISLRKFKFSSQLESTCISSKL